jgi:hypothetical protein
LELPELRQQQISGNLFPIFYLHKNAVQEQFRN